MKKLASKILLLSLGCTLLVGLSGGGVYYYLSQQKQNSDVELMSKTLKNDFDRLIKNEVETMLSILSNYQDLAKEGVLTPEQTIDLSLKSIRTARYGENGYFWADKSDGTCTVLLGKDAEGKNRIDAKDAKGFLFIQEIIKNALNGGGYTDYWFSKSTGTEPFPKRGYSAYFEPLDLVIGTGNYIDQIDGILDELKAANHASRNKTVTLYFFSVLIILIITGFIAFYIGLKISNPLVVVTDKIKQISDGDLTVEIETSSQDEIGVLVESIRTMVIKLREIITEISSGSENIAVASVDLSRTSDSLSNGATEQAASIEEVSSTMEEIAANIEQNKENSLLTESISKEANQGILDVAERSNSSAEANKEIASKITIINDIAFQTNILALNAAVEAARAGEQGKGFAVVAAEVRKLAERSKEAAEKIVQLANQSNNLALEASDMLKVTIPKVANTTQLVQEISAASVEQNNGTNEVNRAIQQFNVITQQNATASADLSQNAEKLSCQADGLKAAIAFFNIGRVKKQTNKHYQKETQVKPKPVASSNFQAKGSDIVNLNLTDGSDKDFESF